MHLGMLPGHVCAAHHRPVSLQGLIAVSGCPILLMSMHQGKDAAITEPPERKLLLRRPDSGQGAGAISAAPVPAQRSLTTHQLLLDVQSALRKGIGALVRLKDAGAIAGMRQFCLASFASVVPPAQG